MLEENNLITLESIKSLIYTVRGKQVMLDSDVAHLYNCETKRINEKIKRNARRFPEDFCFQLTEEDLEVLKLQVVSVEKDIKSSRSQFATLNKPSRGQNLKYLPYVFTEQGISMLAPLLNSEIAIQVSVNIMRAFVEMRRFINANKDLFQKVITIENKIDTKFIEYDKKFNIIFNELQKEESFKQKVFFEGQIYDAYSLIINIIKQAKRKIVIIDNYIDDSILNMLVKKNKNVETIILTSEKSNILKLDVEKFNKEYRNIKNSKIK
jgi:hypothetical protein